MKPVLVGVAGGMAAGKKTLCSSLRHILKRRGISADIIPYQREITTLTPSDCLLIHGLTPFESQFWREKLDLKIFMDVEADIRLCRMLKNSEDVVRLQSEYLTDLRPFHIKHVIPQRFLSDVNLIGDCHLEKIDKIADWIVEMRNTQSMKICQNEHIEGVYWN